jgi:hypothetical protein
VSVEAIAMAMAPLKVKIKGKRYDITFILLLSSL